VDNVHRLLNDFDSPWREVGSLNAVAALHWKMDIHCAENV